VWAVTDTSQTAIVIYAGPGVGENIVGDSACHVPGGTGDDPLQGRPR